MEQLRLAKWLKIITVIIGFIGLVFLIVIIPRLGTDLVSANPEYDSWYFSYNMASWMLAVPCYIALIFFWKICTNISRDNSFCLENVKYLGYISYLAIFDTVLSFLICMYLFFANMFHPGFLVVFICIIVFGITIAIVAATSAHLVEKASLLKEEHDLTI